MSQLQHQVLFFFLLFPLIKSTSRRYQAIHIDVLLDRATNEYRCQYCQRLCEKTDNAQIKAEKSQLLAEFDEHLAPLKYQLSKLTPEAKPVAMKDITTDQRIQSKKRSNNNRAYGAKYKRELDPSSKPIIFPTNEEPTDDADDITKLDFVINPLLFGEECDVYLEVRETKEEYEQQWGIRLAKEFLDSVAEFKRMTCLPGIENKHFYKYEITELSLFLAHSQGFTKGEIARLLRFLSQKQALPMNLQKKIREKTNSQYYPAFMVLRDKKYHIESESQEIAVQLLQRPNVQVNVQNANRLKKVKSGEGVKFAFEVKKGKAEELKKVT